MKLIIGWGLIECLDRPMHANKRIPMKTRTGALINAPLEVGCTRNQFSSGFFHVSEPFNFIGAVASTLLRSTGRS